MQIDGDSLRERIREALNNTENDAEYAAACAPEFRVVKQRRAWLVVNNHDEEIARFDSRGGYTEADAQQFSDDANARARAEREQTTKCDEPIQLNLKQH